MEVAHIDVFRRDPERFWNFYGRASGCSPTSSRTAPTARSRELEARGMLDAVITQNIDRLHRTAGSKQRDRGARHDRDQLLPGSAETLLRARGGRGAVRRDGRRALSQCGGASSPTSCCSARCCPRQAMHEAHRAVRQRRPAAVRRLVARGVSGRRAAERHARAPAARSRSSPRARLPTTPTRRCGSTATWSRSWRRCCACCEPDRFRRA